MKKIFLRAGKAHKELRRFAIERVEQLGEHRRVLKKEKFKKK